MALTRTTALRQGGARPRTGPPVPPAAPGSAREAMCATLGSDPWERLQRLREAGEERARWVGVAYQVEAEVKITLTRIQGELATVHAKEGLSEAKLERMARAHPKYAEAVQAASEALRRRTQAEGEYWAIRSELEWDRAAVAHANALTRLEE